ncbi:MAG: glycosyltransferase [Candidatus Omnitrophica bacterium]|nr:glycosyltransferase [Candidatus Omnitrophota bacterium]
MPKKVLLLYISEHSGHHCASIAIEKALHSLDSSIQTLNLNSFNYTNPILEKVINRAYMGVVKRRPEIWEYLYDNPKVLRNTQKLRDMFHKFNTGKLKPLLDEFAPSAVVCTQAFPCGMVADYKKSYGLAAPLVGVLTDYAPHSYWIYNNVDRYIVPSKETGKKLEDNGIEAERIMSFGIPIESKFGYYDKDDGTLRRNLRLDLDKPCVLVMGGTQGLGPIKDMVRSLDRSAIDIQLIIVCGTNKRLYRHLERGRFRKKVVVLPYAPNIDKLMQISDLIITKPGGITTAEALAKGLPMLIVNPLPGQEAMNTHFLLDEGVAVKAESPEDVVVILGELLYIKNKLADMRRKALSLSRPSSSIDIARMILEMV